MNPQSKHSYSRRPRGVGTTRTDRARRRHRRAELDLLARRVRDLGERFSPELDDRPHGHVIGHAVGEPLPVPLDGLPHGHIIAARSAHVQSRPGLPHGHVAAARDANAQSFEGLPHGHVVAPGRTASQVATTRASITQAAIRESEVMGVADRGVTVGVMGGADHSRTPDTMGGRDGGARVDVIGPPAGSSRAVTEVFGDSDSSSLDSLFGAGPANAA